MSLAATAVCLSVRAPDASAAPATVAVKAADVSELRTEHYDIHVEGLDVADVGKMLEQLHAQLKTYFGKAPDERLAIGVYATQERWAAALRADRQYVPVGAGGYYAPFTHKAYLWAQPSAYFTRQVILHEATHQFHWLIATGNLAPSALWYTEGIAEYFGMHNWEGKTLQTGVIPAVTLEDYPAAAMRNFEAEGTDLHRLFTFAGRPESWALVHFLIDEHSDQFRRLAHRLDRQDNFAEAWKEVFGGDSSTARLSGELHEWIKVHAQPWHIVWVSWQQRGADLQSDAETSSMTILKETPKILTVEVQPQTAIGAAGLVFGYRSVQDFYMLQLRPGNKVNVVRRQDGAWVRVSTGDLQPGKDRSVLSVSQDDKSTTLWANGKKVGTVPAVGQVGLTAEGSSAVFHIVDSAAPGI
jgi:hypothetical protein